MKWCQVQPLVSTEKGIKTILNFSWDNLKRSLSLNLDASTYQHFAVELSGYDAKAHLVYSATITSCANWLGCRSRTESEHSDSAVCDVYMNWYREDEKSLIGMIGEIQTAAKQVQQVASKAGAETTNPPVVLASAGEQVLGFSYVNIKNEPGFRVAAAPYLHDYGVSIGGMTPPGSQLVLVDNLGLYEGKAVRPTYSQVFLTQTGVGRGAASFTLNFKTPARSVAVTRPKLYAETASGVTHPAWSAHAFGADGQELAIASEGLTRSFTTVPAQTYSLVATEFEGISSVRFDSDYRLNGAPFAGFESVLIERISVVPFGQ